MKLEVASSGGLQIKGTINIVEFETDSGEELIVCVEDTGFKIAVRDMASRDPQDKNAKFYNWYTADSTGIKQMHRTEAGIGETGENDIGC